MTLPAEDIFVSYAREDAEVVAKLVHRLEAEWSVFTDRNIRSGEAWPQRLERKLNGVKCVLVLWSEHASASEWVREEASHGRSRQILVAARLDDSPLPFGFKAVHAEDLRHWLGDTPPAGIVPLMDRIHELVEDTVDLHDREEQDKKLRLASQSTRTEHISVSDHEIDRDAILSKLPHVDPDIIRIITSGYSELEAAQYSARNSPDDRAAEAHYAAAAEHFGRALGALGDKEKFEKARDGRSIEYFLSMEHANSLAFAESQRGQKHEDAIRIYERLAADSRYRNDPPVHFRLGCALARTARRDQATIEKAIRSLLKAREIIERTRAASANGDRLLDEGSWLQFEISKQLGLCNYLLSELPSTPPQRRAKHLEEAIHHTREAIMRPRPEHDPHQLILFTIIKAVGNLIYLLAEKIREGRGDAHTFEEIRRLLEVSKTPDLWAIGQNQLSIIDSIAFGAATIGDWQTAFEEGRRNVENFASLAASGKLTGEEQAMDARAREIVFFAQTMLAGKDVAHTAGEGSRLH